MSHTATSYQFHRELESLAAFIRREWKALAAFGGAFVAVITTAVVAVDPAFFYPRLSTDPLLYYLKGLAFAETGHTAARSAVNRPPFHYVALPGVLRAPFMIAFKNFDAQLRAIQLSNVVFLVITATMFAFILSWVVPRRWHWLAIGFTFGFMLLSPDWVANVFQPLADLPYAVFSVAFIILSTRVICSERRLLAQPVAIAMMVVLFVLTFLDRFTGPFLLIYVALLAAGRRRQGTIHRRTIAILSGIAAVSIFALIVLSWETINVRYLWIARQYFAHGSRVSMIGSIVALAIPSQIIPVFNLGFGSPPIVDKFHVGFESSPVSLLLIELGVAISATVLLGMWRGRSRLTPEVWYCFAAFVVLGPIIQSAGRYFMAYQPFLWIFFYLGVGELLSPIAGRIAARRQLIVAGLAAMTLAAAGLVYLRAQRIGGTASDRRVAVSITGARSYVDEVGSTFRALRNYLETLPRDRTMLVSELSAYGRWKVISGLDYYFPDSAFQMEVTRRDTYLLVECGTLEACQDFPAWDAKLRRGLERYGNFSYDPVFSRITPHGKATVYRIRNAQ
ncbi:MAG: hypothetical protein ABR582_05220 [Gemmatimonadaceae bacterium]